MSFKNTSILSLLFLCVCSFVCADPVRPTTEALPDFDKMTARHGQEMQMLDQLITVTQKNLERQRDLRNQISEYLDLQARYIENTDDKNLSIQLVRKAKQVLEGIQQQHLTQAFDQEFLSELSFFANIAQKWDTPRL
jgi:hypothetical protein